MALKVHKKPAAGDPLAAIVIRIKARNSDYAVETGNDLIAAKALVGHGQWGQWLKENFDWSKSSAHSYMKMAKEVAKNPEFGDLKPASIAALTAKNVPEAVKSEVIADLQAGKKPSLKEVKAKIAAAKEKTKPTKQAQVNQPAPIKSGIMPPVEMDEDAELRDQLRDRGPEASFKLFEEVFGGKLTWALAHEQVAA